MMSKLPTGHTDFKIELMMIAASEVTDHDDILATMIEREDDIFFSQVRGERRMGIKGRL